MSFTVTMLDYAGLSPMATNPLSRLRPLSFSATDRGGYDQAEIEVAGPAQAVQEALRWLRYGVEISNELGSVVWAGYVHQVECTFGGIRYSLSLDQLANKIAVLYSYENADGVQTSGQTEFAEHEVSQARYGVKEMILPASDIELSAAEQMRDTELANRRYPQATGEAEAGAATAKLSCKGWWHTLGWLHYSNDLGREEHTDGDAAQPLGLGFTSTEVGFTKGRTVQDMGGRMRYFPEGQKVIVAGSTSNDGVRTITAAAGEPEALSYTATSISFETDDDILDSDAGFEFVKKGHIIEIAGSSSNDGYHVIDSEGARHLTTYSGFGGTISAESAGASVTLYQGNKVDVAEGLVNEDPGDSVTVTCYGQQIAQSFQLSSGSGWDCARIGIEIASVGSPTDDITVALCSDSAGAPGSVLGSGAIADTDIGEALTWRWAELSSAVTLATSTTYWIKITRGGSADWNDFYSVGVDEGLGYGHGALKVYDGSSWQDRPTAADLKFRVWGAEETTDQIETMAGDAEFIRGVLVEDASGLDTNQYREGDDTILTEIEALLDAGDSSNNRMVAGVTSDRLLHVRAASSIGFVSTASIDGIWRSDGTVASRAGEPLEPGRLLYGVWLEIAEIPPAVDSLAPFSPRYVSGSEYNADSRRLRPTFGERNPFDLGVTAG